MHRIHLSARNLALFLLILSLVLYGADYLVVGKGGDIVSSFMGNLAFLPIYVLFVTLMIERILKERERSAIRQKLNMIIGVFFSEVGTGFLRDFSVFMGNRGEMASRLGVDGAWTDGRFRSAAAFLDSFDSNVDAAKGDLNALKSFLMEKRAFLLTLLENPNLLEHDEFTDLLWAIFHLTEELGARGSLDDLPLSDLEHLSCDMRRAFGLLLREWLRYLKHLKDDYPYLFSLAVRTNPMNPAARVIVE
ncbi:MAG TPA: hypothetical protein PK036_09750 [Geobacteraceae bacterium]|nr:hypothetical protein [Geobacteraceae bacterium]